MNYKPTSLQQKWLDLQQIVFEQGSETKEKRAIMKYLREDLGFKDTRSSKISDRTPDGRHVRIYVWRDTPIGTIALTTGPNIVPEIHFMVHGNVAAEYINHQPTTKLLIPAAGQRPTLFAVPVPQRLIKAYHSQSMGDAAIKQRPSFPKQSRGKKKRKNPSKYASSKDSLLNKVQSSIQYRHVRKNPQYDNLNKFDTFDVVSKARTLLKKTYGNIGDYESDFGFADLSTSLELSNYFDEPVLMNCIDDATEMQVSWGGKGLGKHRIFFLYSRSPSELSLKIALGRPLETPDTYNIIMILEGQKGDLASGIEQVRKAWDMRDQLPNTDMVIEDTIPTLDTVDQEQLDKAIEDDVVTEQYATDNPEQSISDPVDPIVNMAAEIEEKAKSEELEAIEEPVSDTAVIDEQIENLLNNKDLESLNFMRRTYESYIKKNLYDKRAHRDHKKIMDAIKRLEQGTVDVEEVSGEIPSQDLNIDMFKSKDILEIDFVSGFGAQQGTFIVTRVTSPKGYYKKVNLKVYKDGKVKKGGVAFALVAFKAGDSPTFAIGDLAVYNFKVKLLGNQKTGMVAQAETKPESSASQPLNVDGTPVKVNRKVQAYSFEKQDKVLQKLLSATATDPALVVNAKTVDFLNNAVNMLFFQDDKEDLTLFSGEPIGFKDQTIGYKLDMVKSLSSDDIIQLLAFIRCLGFQIVNVDKTDNQINYNQPKDYNIAKVINSLVNDPEGAREGLGNFGMYFLPMENNYSRPVKISVDWSEAAAKYSSKTAQIAEETVETTTDVPEPVETPSQAIEEPVRAKQNLDYYQLLWYEGEQFDFLPDDTKIYTPWALTRVLEFLAFQAPAVSDEAGYNKVKILTVFDDGHQSTTRIDLNKEDSKGLNIFNPRDGYPVPKSETQLDFSDEEIVQIGNKAVSTKGVFDSSDKTLINKIKSYLEASVREDVKKLEKQLTIIKMPAFSKDEKALVEAKLESVYNSLSKRDFSVSRKKIKEYIEFVTDGRLKAQRFDSSAKRLGVMQTIKTLYSPVADSLTLEDTVDILAKIRCAGFETIPVNVAMRIDLARAAFVRNDGVFDGRHYLSKLTLIPVEFLKFFDLIQEHMGLAVDVESFFTKPFVNIGLVEAIRKASEYTLVGTYALKVDWTAEAAQYGKEALEVAVESVAEEPVIEPEPVIEEIIEEPVIEEPKAVLKVDERYYNSILSAKSLNYQQRLSLPAGSLVMLRKVANGRLFIRFTEVESTGDTTIASSSDDVVLFRYGHDMNDVYQLLRKLFPQYSLEWIQENAIGHDFDLGEYTAPVEEEAYSGRRRRRRRRRRGASAPTQVSDSVGIGSTLTVLNAGSFLQNIPDNVYLKRDSDVLAILPNGNYVKFNRGGILDKGKINESVLIDFDGALIAGQVAQSDIEKVYSGSVSPQNMMRKFR